MFRDKKGDEEGNPEASIIRAPIFRTTSPEDLEKLFAAAQARGNEGLMIKYRRQLRAPKGRRV